MVTQEEYKEMVKKNEVEHKGLACLQALDIGALIFECGEQEVIGLIEDLISRRARDDQKFIQVSLSHYCNL